ncbi:copper ABC transporter permease [Haladaptatus paucihalophilus DX253]|uniref:ABC-type transport system involved in multi-copper enzyme maturation, permease component n=1 Tax=Haladaptatus paucihalophilus DX253 TaxID=797209 RepID=E7QW28_HALPU|nr:ABC transporter permease subunit [Haladaptatus paucihalophilus]EFW91441.1 copper ABC transporter permease [Haladaptatus paucihalophilus DX253]SHL01154.1 ABC-type transport system involved in multi-copper enzyme maturation, permease component [Haladaptatus paucihalophilus DX253]
MSDETATATQRPTRADRGLGLRAAGPVFRRELTTIRRSRAYLGLAGGFAVAVVGLTLLGGGVTVGYVPMIIDLLTYVEVLVPVVAFALGYRAVLDDRISGELAVLRTFPLPRAAYVVGVVAARLCALVVLLTVPLALVGAIAFLRPEPAEYLFATTSGADSPVLYVRFVSLTLLYGIVNLVGGIAVSATARSVRTGVVVAVISVVTLSLGFDLFVLSGLAEGMLGERTLAAALALGPASAYRALVMTTVIGATTSGVTTIPPLFPTVALLAWAAVLLAVAIRRVW